MTEKDEFEEIDRAFGQAFKTVHDCSGNALPITGAVEDAVDTMFDLAFQQADPSMLRMCMTVCFTHFIDEKRCPPWAALEHIKGAFLRGQKPEAPSLNAAFGMAQDGRGARSRWGDRVYKRLQFIWMDMLTDNQSPEKLSVEDAAAEVEALFHAKDVKRSYSKYRGKVKRIKSE